MSNSNFDVHAVDLPAADWFRQKLTARNIRRLETAVENVGVVAPSFTYPDTPEYGHRRGQPMNVKRREWLRPFLLTVIVLGNIAGAIAGLVFVALAATGAP